MPLVSSSIYRILKNDPKVSPLKITIVDLGPVFDN